MIKLIKDHFYKFLAVICLLILDVYVVILALTPANMDITAPGGLNEVKSVIEADTNTNIKGSFNTIYVYSIERASILQTYVASLANYNEVSDSSTIFHLSKEESKKSGVVQKNQSIEASLICAYNYANKVNSNIHLDYALTGFIVRNYQINHNIFKIGDLITKVYDKEADKTITIQTPNDLYKKISPSNLKVGDVITYLRDGNEYSKPITTEFEYYEKANYFYVYPKYQINRETANPSYTLHQANTLGPSGGLLQTLSVYSQISGIDLTYGKKIAGTGTIDVVGNVGIIGGVSQKIVTAIHNGADVFLCPEANYEEALKTYNKTPGHKKMKLIMVRTFEEAVLKLGEMYGN